MAQDLRCPSRSLCESDRSFRASPMWTRCHSGFRPAPRVVARIARSRHVVEAPEFLACVGIVRFDEAALTSATARSAGNHFAIDDDCAGGILRVRLVRFPAHLAVVASSATT